MAIRVQRHANISKEATLLDGLDVSPLKWECGLNRFIHEGMNHISNVKVHLKTLSGKVNIIIRIYHECEARIELSFPRIAVWHHEACRVMTNGDLEGRIFFILPLHE